MTDEPPDTVRERGEEIPCAFRAGAVDAGPFVFSSWLKSHRNEGDNKHMANDVYFARMQHRINSLLHRSATIVAHNPDDAGQIYGWMCFEGPPPVIHYVYVKYPFRRLGVARRLFAIANPIGAPIRVTHTGRCSGAVKHRYQLTYDPSELTT